MILTSQLFRTTVEAQRTRVMRSSPPRLQRQTGNLADHTKGSHPSGTRRSPPNTVRSDSPLPGRHDSGRKSSEIYSVSMQEVAQPGSTTTYRAILLKKQTAAPPRPSATPTRLAAVPWPSLTYWDDRPKRNQIDPDLAKADSRGSRVAGDPDDPSLALSSAHWHMPGTL